MLNIRIMHDFKSSFEKYILNHFLIFLSTSYLLVIHNLLLFCKIILNSALLTWHIVMLKVMQHLTDDRSIFAVLIYI